MRFPVVVERTGANLWAVECPSIPGCALCDETLEGAFARIKKGIKASLELMAGRRLPIGVELLPFFMRERFRGATVTPTGESERIAALIAGQWPAEEAVGLGSAKEFLGRLGGVGNGAFRVGLFGTGL